MICTFENRELIPLEQFGKNVTRWHKGHFVSASVCSNCAYVGFTSPSDDELSDYYSNHYGKQAESWYNITADYAEAKVNSRASNVLQLLERYITSTKPTTLEVGCAFGGTVHELRRRGINALGVDLNSDAIEQARRHGNQHVYVDFVHTLMQKLAAKTNVIYSYHALQHVPNVLDFLESLHPSLAAESVLEFRVPNANYLRAWQQGFEKWDWFAYPDHLHMFTPKSVSCLAASAGFNILEISSSACGESVEQIRNWSNISADSLPDQPMIDLLERAMLLQELRFVLCPIGSELSTRYHDAIHQSAVRCNESQDLECILRTKLDSILSQLPINVTPTGLGAMFLKSLQPKETRRLLILPPSSPGSKGDEGMVRGALYMTNGINTVLLNPDTSPSWIDLLGDEYSSAETLQEELGPLLNFAPKILPADELLVLGADVIDGTCGLDPSFMRLDLMDNALSVGAGVSVFCSFRSNVNPAIIERIKAMPKASFYLRDELSLHSFKSQTGMVAEFFPDFFSFCGVNNSARVKSYRQRLISKKRSGQTLVGLNFSEHAFRSLYDEHNQANRERYVESVVSSVLDAVPNAFFALFSNDSRRWDNFPPDSEYQNLARSSLLTRTDQDCFVLVDPDITYPETISLLSSVEIMVTGRMHLCLAASRSGTVPIVLMGHGKGYSSIEKMKGGFDKYIGTTTLVVPETKELESTIRRALGQFEDLKRTIKRRNKTNAAQASVDLERLRSKLGIN